MKYMESYRFLFRSPNWITNLLLCTVAQFVPVIGPMVFLGYQFEIIEFLHRRGDGDYPDVDLDRLNRYLGRGAWLFLVHLVVYLPLIPFPCSSISDSGWGCSCRYHPVAIQR